MTNERTLIADRKILAAAYAPVPDPDFVVAPPFTCRDLGDLEAISQRLDWLRREMRAGITPSETTHGPTIRAVTQALKRLEAKAAAASHVSTHYIWRTRDDDKVRPEHAANNGKIFAWNDPPPTGHPGADFGCRCWAEPYTGYVEELQESVHEKITTYTSESLHMWNDDDLKHHYFHGRGRDLMLDHIGLLEAVIKFARTQTQKSGGSIFDRVVRKIFIEARKNGPGQIKVHFGTSYDFSDLLFSLGDSTIEGEAAVNVTAESGFLMISAEIYYTFWDEYKDPFDIWDVAPIDVEAPGGNPYKIMDT